MHAPEHVCEALHRLHPGLRLAWRGRPRSVASDGLNLGSFALVQLYHRRDRERTCEETWTQEMGPIFGKPFDTERRIPVWKTDVDVASVFSGSFIEDIERWMTDLRRRIYESKRAEGRAEDDAIHDLAEQIGDHMWHAHQRDGAPRGQVVANKFKSDRDNAAARGETFRTNEQQYVDSLPAEFRSAS